MHISHPKVPPWDSTPGTRCVIIEIPPIDKEILHHEVQYPRKNSERGDQYLFATPLRAIPILICGR
jgi:hypothetical protein